MARKKPAIPKIASRQEADATLAEIARLERQLDTIKTTLNDDIDQLKTKAREESEPLQANVKSLADALGAYATYNKATLFEKSKTLVANHGRYGFRKATSLKTLPRMKWTDVLAKIKELGRTELIRKKEEVNKELVRELPTEDVESLGARLVSVDEFWYETDQEEVEDVA